MKSPGHGNMGTVARRLGVLALAFIMIGVSITPVLAWDERGHRGPKGYHGPRYDHGRRGYHGPRGYYMAPPPPVVYAPPPPVVYAPPPPPPGISLVFPLHIH